MKKLIDCASLSERGFVRRENQDSVLALPDEGFFCVADGMGGGEGGALASKWICEELKNAFEGLGEVTLPEKKILVEATLQHVNKRIKAYAKENKFHVMGSTCAAIFFDPAELKKSGSVKAMICNIGDSRVYVLRRGQFALLTNDHTVGNELGSAMDKLHHIEALEIRSRHHELSHILTRAVGTEMRVRADYITTNVRAGDVFLICTDGVHDMLEDEVIGGILVEENQTDKIVDSLACGIFKEGAIDNFTMVCFAVNS